MYKSNCTILALIVLWGAIHTARCIGPEPEVVLLIGGKTSSDWSSNIRSVEVFGQVSCSPNLTLPDDRKDSTSNYVDGHVLVCGGLLGSSSCLQLVDGEFKYHSSLKAEREDHSGVVLKGKLILMGGFPWSDGSANSMETLNGTTWTLSNNKLEHGTDVYKSCVVALDNTRAMVIGGFDSDIIKYGDDVSIYDAEKGWTSIKSLPERTRVNRDFNYTVPGGRYEHSCVVLENGKVLVAGGIGAVIPLETAVIYNGDSWTILPGRLNTGRSHGQMVKMNGRILYFGGYDINDKTLDTVEEFDEDAGTWTLLQKTMQSPRKYFGAVVVPASVVGCHL